MSDSPSPEPGPAHDPEHDPAHDPAHDPEHGRAAEQSANSPGDGAAQRGRLFRREAIEYQAGAQHEAHVLQITPVWTQRAYWLLVVVCSVALFYVVVGRINEYASGTAIIQAEGRVDVTARLAGTVESVAVRPGQRVDAGQVLARLYFGNEAAELHRIDDEFEMQLVKVLRDPGDASARGALTSLRAQRDLALARVEERTIRATRAGVVSDVRIRRGQQLQPGDLVLSLIGETGGFRVVAVLPGQYRPLLQPGMPLRLELRGYPYAYQTVPIETVGDEVVGPAEVRRYLGPVTGDTFDPQGPMVLVEAHLPDRTFTSQGRSLAYHEGMQAQAEVPVRAESILVTLIPGLESILRQP